MRRNNYVVVLVPRIAHNAVKYPVYMTYFVAISAHLTLIHTARPA